MARNTVRELFSEGLPLLYGAHHQGAAQAAANRRTSTSPKLRAMLKSGDEANIAQARRLERVFKSAGLAPRRKHDKAMQGIIDANNSLVAKARDPAARDLVNIELGQVAAHFYLATYGTLRNYAEFMGNSEAVNLLQRTLDETGAIDKEFTRLAQHLARQSGSRDYGREGPPHTTVAMHPAITVAAVVGLVAAGFALTGGRDGAGQGKPRRPDGRGRPAPVGEAVVTAASR